MLDWDDLRHFTALADEGSLSAAARRLRVEHATVARRITALEAAAGAKLVDRRAGRYVLTPQGKQVAEYARRMETEVFRIERALRAGQNEVEGEVSVSTPPLMATNLIAPRLSRLKEAHPALRLRLLGESRTVSLPRREADIAVRLARPTDGTLVARKVGAVSYRLYGSSAYLASRAPETYEFIAFDESMAEAPHQIWLRSVAGSRSVVLLTNDLAIQCAAAGAGIGLAALPVFIGEAAGLKPVESEAGVISRDIWLTFHRDLRGTAAIAVVAEFLAECFQQARRPDAKED